VHRTDTAVGRSRDDRVADLERSRLDEHGRHGAASLVELRLDGDTARVLVGVGAQVESGIRGEQNGVEQFGDADVVERRDIHEHRVAAVLLGDETEFGQLLTHLGGVGAVLVDLVDRDDDRHASGLSVVERLHRLRHDAVVGRDHEDRDIGHLGTAGAHGGERLVARGVDEGDGALVALVLGPDLVRTDVLRDAAGLARNDVGVADRVEQLGLSVVDVTHDGHDGRTDLEHRVVLVLELLVEVEVEAGEQLAVLVLRGDHLDLVVELAGEDRERLLIQGLGGRGHLSEVEERGHEAAGHHLVAGDRLQLVGEIGDGCSATQADDELAVTARNADATERRGLAQLELGALRALRLAGLALAATATERSSRAATGTTPATTGTAGGRTVGSEVVAGGATGRAATGAEAAAGTGRTTGAAGTLLERGALAGTVGEATGTRRARARGARGRSWDRARATGTLHALVRGEGVVARTRRAGALHPLVRSERVVARTRDARAGQTRGAGRRVILGRRGLGSGGVLCGLGLGLTLGDRERHGGHLDLGLHVHRRRGRRGGVRGLRRRARRGLRLLRRGGGGLHSIGDECFLDLAGHGGRDARRRALDVLAHLLELVEHDLGFDAQFGSDLVNSWVCHISPVWA
jgi:hypothetical protein